MQTMKIPVLLDDLICFAMAIAIATLSSFLGAWLGGATRERRLLYVPEWRPIRNGALVAAAMLYVSGVGALWFVGHEAVDFRLFGYLFWDEHAINQGLITLAWMMICTIGWVLAVCAIAMAVAFTTASLCRPDREDVRWFRFSLRTFFILLIAASIALGLWIGARQKSINYQRAVAAARTAWRPYGLEPQVDRQGEVWSLRRKPFGPQPKPGKPAMKLSERVFHDMAELSLLEDLDLSGLDIPEHAFETLIDAPRLHILDLSGTDVTDQQLQSIAKLRVSILYLNGTRVSDAGLRNLAPMIQHQKVRGVENPGVSLNLYNTQVTPAGILELEASGKAIGGGWWVNTKPRE